MPSWSKLSQASSTSRRRAWVSGRRGMKRVQQSGAVSQQMS